MGYSSEIESKKDGFIGERMIYIPGIVKRKILNDARVCDLFITHIGIFPEAQGHLRNRPLGCSQYILLYCVEGEGWVEVDGKRQKILANQLFIIEPKKISSYGANSKKPWTNYWIHYTGDNAAIYSPAINQIIDIQPCANSRKEERLLLFEEMLQNASDYFNFERVVYANICLKQFLTSIKYLNVYRAINREPESDLLKNVISFMKNNLHKNIRISEIAERFSCSNSNIYKIFKTNLDSSPLDFFIHLKMERARKYLMQTNLKVKEIGLKLGYEDPYYFSRVFAKHVGLSPGHFRREER